MQPASAITHHTKSNSPPALPCLAASAPCPSAPLVLLQVRDRATLYLYQLQRAAEGPDSVDPHWRIPAKGLEAALARYLAAPDTDQPFDLVRQSSAGLGWAGWGGAVGCGLATIPHPALHAAGWLWMAAACPHARHVVPPKC
jgi:hypothetical protein